MRRVNKQNERGSGRTPYVKLFMILCFAGSIAAQVSSDNFMKSFYGSQRAPDLQPGSKRSSHVQHETNAHICPKKDVDEIIKKSSKSQSQEDKMLLQWFNGLCNGTYVEMGGLDGITFSNSYLFNKELDWRGVLVELSPSDYEKMKVNRPDDTTVHAAVCDKRRTVHYLTRENHPVKTASAVDGIYEFMPESFRNQWWKGVTLESLKDAEVECIPMSEILERSPYTYFDFYSLDVEGAEYEVLQSIDFEKVAFGIMLVEADEHNHRKNLAIRTFMESKGYTLLMDHERSYWFVNQDFSTIYKDLLHN